ncbi:MAG: fumarylacetoacetate hydrolase family protein [Dehalobacterium sp.]
MQFVRFQKENIVSYGIVRDDQVFLVQGSIYDDFSISEKSWRITDVKLLCPCEPSKIICVGLNYSDHAREVGLEIPKYPVIFMKPPSTVIGPNDSIIYPASYVKRLDYEAELAVVIKKQAKNVPEENALDFCLGYTCGNDVTARNLQPKDGQWTVAKSFDTFMPLGPVINTDVIWDDLDISCMLNGVEKQKSHTKNLIFSVPYLISYLSKIMTLLPGDVIITGTPSGISPMVSGDEVSVIIKGIGTLTNKVEMAIKKE